MASHCRWYDERVPRHVIYVTSQHTNSGNFRGIWQFLTFSSYDTFKQSYHNGSTPASSTPHLFKTESGSYRTNRSTSSKITSHEPNFLFYRHRRQSGHYRAASIKPKLTSCLLLRRTHAHQKTRYAATTHHYEFSQKHKPRARFSNVGRCHQSVPRETE